MSGSRSAFIVKDIADAEFVLSEESGIERDLVPIGQRVARFQAECCILQRATVSFHAVFNREIDSIRQSDFDLLSKRVIGAAKVNNVIFIDQAAVNCSRRKNVSVRGRRKTRLREADRRPVSSWKFFAG